ncbi:hypothetical protein RQP46_008262 [Phenoliferia psychrophenolica]
MSSPASEPPEDPRSVSPSPSPSPSPPRAAPKTGTVKPKKAHFSSTLSLTDLNLTDDSRPASPEPLPTPTLSQSYGEFRRTLSVKSLRDLEAKELTKHVWRKGGRGEPGERRHRPKDMDQLVNYALRGASRSFILGCSLRAGVNLVVVALRITKKRRVPPSLTPKDPPLRRAASHSGIHSGLVLQALFGTDTIRFGGMLGIFTFLYKFVLHALRFANPGPKGLGHEEVWHSAIAGAVSGLAVWAEKPSRRVTIGQQLLVRGMQSNYNVAYARGWVRIPHGDILLFGAACGQIMYSWLMAPEALPPGYRRFITGASRVAEPCLPVNLSVTRYGTFDPSEARRALEWKGGATPQNASIIEQYASNAEKGDFGPPFAPWMFPVYAALHIIPPMLLRYKVFLKDPQRVLLKSALGTLRSCSFLATFVTLFQGLVCSQRNIYYAIHGRVPEWVEKILLHKGYYWISGFATCLSLSIEEKKRRGELAMYVLPRGLESLWSVLRRKSYVPFVPGGEILMTSAGLAMVMSTYAHEPRMLSGLVRSVLYQIIGHG